MVCKVKPVVLSGPSGCGKSTLIKKLMANYPDTFGFSVSHTTRQPRPGEEHGKDYYFIERATMLKQIDNGEFIEHATYNNNIYGTSKKAVQDVLDEGRVCIMDIDSQGVKSVKKTDLNCLFLFVKPPSLEELQPRHLGRFGLNLGSFAFDILPSADERRLRGRGTETEESIQRRLAASKIEFEYADQPGSYQYHVINDDLEKAYADLKEIITKEIGCL